MRETLPPLVDLPLGGQKPSVFGNKGKKNLAKTSNCNLIKKPYAVEVQFIKYWPRTIALLHAPTVRL